VNQNLDILSSTLKQNNHGGMMINKKSNIFLIFIFAVLILASCSKCECEETDSSIKIEHHDGIFHLQLDEDSPLEIGKSICFYMINDTENLIIFPKTGNIKVEIFDESKKEWVEVENQTFEKESPTPAIRIQDQYFGLQPRDMIPECATPLIRNTQKSVRLLISVRGNVYRGSQTEFEESGITNEVMIAEIEVTLKAAQTK
jgi:hypothetical protein